MRSPIMDARKYHPYISWLGAYQGIVISDLMIIESEEGFFWGRFYYEDEVVGVFIRESILYPTVRKAYADEGKFPVNVCEDTTMMYTMAVIPQLCRLGDAK